MLAGEFADQFDGADFVSDCEHLAVEPLVHEVISGAIHEGLRNAAIHGRGEVPGRALHISITVCTVEGLSITLADDGVGLGATTGAAGGSRQGLALHSTLMAVIGGSLELRPGVAGGTILTLRLS